MSAVMDFDDKSISIDHIVRQLEADTFDLDNSLDKFLRSRSEVLASQKRAFARFEEELFQIEESTRVTPEMEEQRKANIDHNIFKHLNIDLQSEQLKRIEPDPMDELGGITAKPIDDAKMSYFLIDHNSFIERNKKLSEWNNNTPPPSFEQKKQVREAMFSFLDESTIEETRLELEIEQATQTGDLKLADELADALYLLQKINNDRLNNMISDYRPLPASRTWGSDPEYANLSKQLVAISEAYSIQDFVDSSKRR